jgi:hypothetical protein
VDHPPLLFILMLGVCMMIIFSECMCLAAVIKASAGADELDGAAVTKSPLNGDDQLVTVCLCVGVWGAGGTL